MNLTSVSGYSLSHKLICFIISVNKYVFDHSPYLAFHLVGDKSLLSDVASQKVQTVQSWLAEANSSVIDARLADHVLLWAQTTIRSAVRKNLEEPYKHFQNYGEKLTF